MAENVLVALVDVRQMLSDESRSEEDFHVAAGHFLEVFHANLEERGGALTPAPLEEWDPRPALLVLEGELLADTQLDDGYFAAAKTIRDSLDAASQQLASQN